VRETPSKNGLFPRWQFLAPEYNGIPVVIDVNAYPTPDQMLSAMGGCRRGGRIYLHLAEKEEMKADEFDEDSLL
jgi:hypothetical protein